MTEEGEREGDVARRVFWTSNLYFFIKGNWICSMTRHNAESNINILLTRNIPIDSGVRQ